jgi:hypothetical protein
VLGHAHDSNDIYIDHSNHDMRDARHLQLYVDHRASLYLGM